MNTIHISFYLEVISDVKSILSLCNGCLFSLQLYNEVETCVRNLSSLDVETRIYDCLLIPILKEKLPEEMLMVI